MKISVSIPVTLALLGVLAQPVFAEDKDCTDFKTKQEAQDWLDKYKNSPKADEMVDDDLDDNNNGVACEDYNFETGQYTGQQSRGDSDDDD